MVLGTRDNIINAFFRLALKDPKRSYFSLSEIATEAKVTRQAIYRKHYQNFDEILEEVRNKIGYSIRNCLNFSNPNLSISPIKIIAKDLLPEAYKYRIWLRVLSKSSVDSLWQIEVEQQLKNYFLLYLKDNFLKTNLSQEDRAEFLSKIVVDLLIFWLQKELPEPPETFAKTFLILMNVSANDLVS